MAPVLQGQLQEVLGRLCAAFPPARACLDAAAQGGGALPGGVAASRPPPAAIALIRDNFDDDEDDMEGASSIDLRLFVVDLWHCAHPRQL